MQGRGSGRGRSLKRAGMPDNRASLTLSVDCAELQLVLDELSAALQCPHLSERFGDVVAGLVEAAGVDLDAVATTRTRGDVVVFEPSQRLLGLVASVREAQAGCAPANGCLLSARKAEISRPGSSCVAPGVFSCRGAQ